MIEDGLEPMEDGGSELRVPVGEPSGVKIAGWSVVAAARRVNWPFLFRNCGSVRCSSRAASSGERLNGGVIRTDGTGGRLGNGSWVLGAGLSGSGSGFRRTEKTRFRIDRFRISLPSPRG